MTSIFFQQPGIESDSAGPRPGSGRHVFGLIQASTFTFEAVFTA
jgi:hypothetical protein